MSNLTLYRIADDLQALDALLAEVGGDVTDEEANAAIDAWLNELGEARDRKLDGYAALIRTIEAREKVKRDEASRLTREANFESNAIDRLKRRLADVYRHMGWKSVKTDRFTITLAGHGGKQPLVFRDGFTIDDCPPEYQRVKVEPDTEKIRAALESGASLPFASLGERGSSIRIK